MTKFFLLIACKELCKEGLLLPYCFKKLLPLRQNCRFGQTLLHVSTHPGVLQIFTMGDLQEINCLGRIQHYRISFFSSLNMLSTNKCPFPVSSELFTSFGFFMHLPALISHSMCLPVELRKP